MSSLHSCKAVEDLIQKYVDLGGTVEEVIPGTLGYGLTLLYGYGLKSIVIREVYLNEWSSAHTVRMYKKMPKEYERMLEEVV